MESDCERVLGVLDQLGVEYKRETGGRAKICCPFHDEKTPSMCIYDSNSCYCFGCQKRCWHDELIAKLANCSLVEAKQKLGTYDPNANYVYTSTGDSRISLQNFDFADPPQDYSAAFAKLPDEVPEHMLEFLKSKGLDKVATTLGKWRWHPRGTLKCWERQEGIAIPYFGPEGQISTFRLRRYDRMRQKFEHPLAPKGVPLQASYLIHDKTKPFYFCEGESDSLSMFSTGRNVICLPGVGARKQLHSAIMQCLCWKVPKLIFCGDNDAAGKEFNKYAIKAAYTLGLSVFRPQLREFSLPEEYNALKDGSFKRKDINDFLVEGRLEQVLDEFEHREERAKQAYARRMAGVVESSGDSLKLEEKKDNWGEIMKKVKEIFGDVEELPVSEIEGVF